MNEDRGLRIENGEEAKAAQKRNGNSILHSRSSILVARALYEKNGRNFEEDLREYRWPNGVIVERPDCFGIAFATKTANGEWTWFVKVAVGELNKLLSLFPVRLPFISFCRSKSGKRLKTYRLDRLSHLASLIPSPPNQVVTT